MMDPAIEFALAKSRQAEAWVRPYVMEALIRNGSKHGEVLTAFDATDDEAEEVVARLARPSLYGDVAR